MNEYYRFLQTHDGTSCPDITIEAVYEEDGTTAVTPDGSGSYHVTDGEGYFIKLTDVTTGSNAPVITGIAPSMGDSSLIVYTSADAKKNMLEYSVDGGSGQNTYTVGVTWDDGTCTRTTDLTFKVNISQ